MAVPVSLTIDTRELDLVLAEICERAKVLGDAEVRRRVGNLTKESMCALFQIESTPTGFRVALTEECDYMLQKLWK